jgi:hypothetical protein
MTHTDRIKADLNFIWRSRMRHGDTVAEGR